jgi:negative regulator of sigma E activity
MSEQEQVSQLSALFDDELPPEQSELVIRRALREPALRASWGRYALIGACLRSEPLCQLSHQGDIAARVRRSLSGEAVHEERVAAGSRTMSRRTWLGRGVLGGAIAASVAAGSLLLVRAMAPDARPGTAVAALSAVQVGELRRTPDAGDVPGTAQALMVARESSPPSYTTPVDNSPAARRVNAPLVNYVVAHSEVAGSAVRFSPLSSVVNGSYDLTQGTVEMTAAEIREHR